VEKNAHGLSSGSLNKITGVKDHASPDELTLAQVMLPEDANPRGNVHGLAVTTAEARRRWEEAERRRARRMRHPARVASRR
jgi:hypothetical protein